MFLFKFRIEFVFCLFFFWSIPSQVHAHQCRDIFLKNHRPLTAKERLFALFGHTSGVRFFDYKLTNGNVRDSRAENEWIARPFEFPPSGVLAVEIVRTEKIHILRFKFFDNFDSIGPKFSKDMEFAFHPITGLALSRTYNKRIPSESTLLQTMNDGSLRLLTQDTKSLHNPNGSKTSFFGVMENYFEYSPQESSAPGTVQWLQSFQQEVLTSPQNLHARRILRILELIPFSDQDPELIHFFSAFYYSDR